MAIADACTPVLEPVIAALIAVVPGPRAAC
jgi:hypothetical protein